MQTTMIILKQSQLHSCKLIFPFKSLHYVYIPCFRLGGMTLTAGGFVYCLLKYYEVSTVSTMSLLALSMILKTEPYKPILHDGFIDH